MAQYKERSFKWREAGNLKRLLFINALAKIICVFTAWLYISPIIAAAIMLKARIVIAVAMPLVTCIFKSLLNQYKNMIYCMFDI